MNMVLVGRDEGGKKNIRTFWRVDAIETSEPRFITRKARKSFRFGSEHICRAGEAGALLRGAFCFARSGLASKHIAILLRRGQTGKTQTTLLKGTEPESGRSVFRRRKCRALRNFDIQGNWGRRLNVERQSATNVGRAHVEERRPPRLLIRAGLARSARLGIGKNGLSSGPIFFANIRGISAKLPRFSIMR